MDEGPAFGALICAINYSEGLEQETSFHRFNKVKKIYLPNANNFSVYREVFTLFKKYSQKNYDESIL